MQRFFGVNGEVLPSTDIDGWLLIEHVLQRYRDTWVLIDKHPFLSVDLERVISHCESVSAFAVFSNGRMMQNIRPSEGGNRLLSALMGSGVNAGMTTDANIIVEGAANPQANWMLYFNDPFYIGMHPFAALGTHYVYIDDQGSYQHTIADLKTIDGKSRPNSEHVNFDRLADIVRIYHDEYVNGPPEKLPDLARLELLLDEMFAENEIILAAAHNHHATQPVSAPYDYAAPILTRYGRLTHTASGTPRVEISFALLHYEKALHEFDSLRLAIKANNSEAAFLHGVYCVVAIAACIEAIANKLVFQQSGTHPDYRDRRQPLQKVNESAAALASIAGIVYVPLAAGQTPFDRLEMVRRLRNSFMHANERDEEIDDVTLTSILFTSVDEVRCREYLQSVRLATAQVFDQLPDLPRPIVTRENLKWMGDIEVP